MQTRDYDLMIPVKIGSSIKVIDNNGKEEFLTVETMNGDAAFFRGAKCVATRSYRGDIHNPYFVFCNNTYKIEG